ncbi:MAG: anti-sigma factor family protein [Opitutaceae bacterium]
MNAADKIQIEAYLDGELSAEEVQAVETLLRYDKEAAQYSAQIEATREALAASAPPTPDIDQEWQSLADKLESNSDAIDERPASAKTITFPVWVGGLAAMLVVGLFFAAYMNRPGASGPLEVAQQEPIELIETTIENASPVIYVDETSGWTVVWVSEDSALSEPII